MGALSFNFCNFIVNNANISFDIFYKDINMLEYTAKISYDTKNSSFQLPGELPEIVFSKLHATLPTIKEVYQKYCDSLKKLEEETYKTVIGPWRLP